MPIANEFDMYLSGMSIPEISSELNIPKSTLRFRFKNAGILRDRTEAIRISAEKGKLGTGMLGKKRVFTDQHKQNISKARIEYSKNESAGVSIKPSGYAEFTTGEFKGKLVHVVVMEIRLGRPLLNDENVHHIDGNKSNNLDNNLALVTASGHMRLHRILDELSGKIRERNENGTWR